MKTVNILAVCSPEAQPSSQPRERPVDVRNHYESGSCLTADSSPQGRLALFGAGRKIGSPLVPQGSCPAAGRTTGNSASKNRCFEGIYIGTANAQMLRSRTNH